MTKSINIPLDIYRFKGAILISSPTTAITLSHPEEDLCEKGSRTCAK